MRYKAFGATGVELPVIGQGTWNMPESGGRRREAQRALRRGVELGMVHIDTAEMYGSGGVEEMLGEAIRGIAREKLFIASKVLPSNAGYRATLAAAERSLRRLNCEYLDLYLLHWPGSHPLQETMRAFDALVAQGKARFVGVSNFEADAMVEAAGYLSAPMACNQVLYHLCERGIEHELVVAARRHGIALVAYTPFGRGSFLRSEAACRAALEGVAHKHGATVRQVALAFLTREPGLFAIVKAARAEHVEENAGAGDLTLEADDVAALDAAFPRGPAGPLATL